MALPRTSRINCSFPPDTHSRKIPFDHLSERTDLAGGFIEVRGYIPHISALGEIVRLQVDSCTFFPTSRVFLAVRFSHVFKPKNAVGGWRAVDTQRDKLYYTMDYYDFCFGPVLNPNGSISFFCPNASHFITFFPKGTDIPASPNSDFQRQFLWDMLRIQWGLIEN